MFFFLFCVCYTLLRVCLYVPCGHMLGKGWPLGSRFWCPTVSLSLSIGILGQVWYLIVSIPDLCTFTYFARLRGTFDSLCCNTFFSSISLEFATITNLPNSCRSALTDKIVFSFESFTENFLIAVANVLSFVLVTVLKKLTSFSSSRFSTKFFMSKSPLDFASSSSLEVVSGNRVQCICYGRVCPLLVWMDLIPQLLTY